MTRNFPNLEICAFSCLRKAQADMATAESKELFAIAHKTSKVIDPKP